MMSGTMDILSRVARPLLLIGAAALLVAIPFGIATGSLGVEELPWLALGFTFLVTATYVHRRLPEHPVANWFAVVGGGFGLIQSLDGALSIPMAADDASRSLALIALAYHLGAVGAVIAVAHVLGLFPDGRTAMPSERRALGTLRALLLFPPLAFVASPTIVLPAYHLPPVVTNPYHLDVMGPLAIVATTGIALTPAAFVVGLVLLVRRYRRGSRDARRRIRWLLVPALLAGFGAVLDSLSLVTGTGAVARPLIDAVWLTSLLVLPLAIAVALLRPDLLDVDRILRRSLVYAALWSLIAVAYVAAAATLGMAAGQRLDVATAVLLTVAATLVFQPARHRLERLADRWVFGARADPAHLVARLGANLAETFDLDSLLPHIERTLEQGLGLAWVRVRIDPDGDPIREPALIVPIVLGTERLGEVHCGPRVNGRPLTDEERELVATLARQAALAVRNVKLTAELGERLQQVRDQAAELERSRARLLRAHETERRRIERNIHDGVQQDLVALLSHSGRIKHQLARDPAAATELIDGFQDGLQRVISELRELAHGIHPTLLTDRGLLEAVEALAARSPIPVTVRADPSLGGQRFSEEVEGTGYFTVAEALTNVIKHARAHHAEVCLQRSHGSLHIEVHDDGAGFDRTPVVGDGLVNMTERIAALGGRLDIDSNGSGTTLHAVLHVSGTVPRTHVAHG